MGENGLFYSPSGAFPYPPPEFGPYPRPGQVQPCFECGYHSDPWCYHVDPPQIKGQQRTARLTIDNDADRYGIWMRTEAQPRRRRPRKPGGPLGSVGFRFGMLMSRVWIDIARGWVAWWCDRRFWDDDGLTVPPLKSMPPASKPPMTRLPPTAAESVVWGQITAGMVTSTQIKAGWVTAEKITPSPPYSHLPECQGYHFEGRCLRNGDAVPTWFLDEQPGLREVLTGQIVGDRTEEIRRIGK